MDKIKSRNNIHYWPTKIKPPKRQASDFMYNQYNKQEVGRKSKKQYDPKKTKGSVTNPKAMNFKFRRLSTNQNPIPTVCINSNPIQLPSSQSKNTKLNTRSNRSEKTHNSTQKS